MENPVPPDLAGLLREILIRHSRLRLTRVRDEDRLAADLGYDSFALLNAILEVEDRYKVEIDPSRLVHLREMTFREFHSLVAAHVAGSGLPPSPAP